MSYTDDVAVQLGELLEHGVRMDRPEELEDDPRLAPHVTQQSVLLKGLHLEHVSDQVIDRLVVLRLGAHVGRSREQVEVAGSARGHGVPLDVALGEAPTTGIDSKTGCAR